MIRIFFFVRPYWIAKLYLKSTIVFVLFWLKWSEKSTVLRHEGVFQFSRVQWINSHESVCKTGEVFLGSEIYHKFYVALLVRWSWVSRCHSPNLKGVKSTKAFRRKSHMNEIGTNRSKLKNHLIVVSCNEFHLDHGDHGDVLSRLM